MLAEASHCKEQHLFQEDSALEHAEMSADSVSPHATFTIFLELPCIKYH